MTEQYLCIHGHFYQPPRENPWLGVIESQVSAKPFHDWNERITKECYSPNAWARVLGRGGLISRLVNNYEYMSFNFGPTLLTWLERHYPRTYRAILEADEKSRERCGGHGNALAQVYNHIIMPLANARDQLTQIRWGKQDFKARFGRDPEGMWLAETAVNTETLKLLAQEGIRFTILAPDQARAVRPLAGTTVEDDWEDVSGGRVDPRRSYRVYFDDKKTEYIDLFFYDGPVSRAVAYERLLVSGSNFLSRIKTAAGTVTGKPILVNLATDGESYGHHFKFGEMALAWLFDQVEKKGDFEITNYGAFLEKFPPEYEARIFENTSWSCAHGIERWRSDCGCCAACKPGWNQAWREPLRQSLDRMAENLAAIYEKQSSPLIKDPWAARDDYVQVLLSPTEETRVEFLKRHALKVLTDEEEIRMLRLLESQVMGLFMFTSCAWFFDDIAGIEPIQILKYAARAIDLVGEWSAKDLRAELLEGLSRAKCNSKNYKDGEDIYNREVESSRIEPSEAAAHFALRSLVKEGLILEGPVMKTIRPVKVRRLEGPGLTVLLGEVRVLDETTRLESDRVFLSYHKVTTKMKALVAQGENLDFDTLTRDLQKAVDETADQRLESVFLSHYPDAAILKIRDLLPEAESAIIHYLSEDLIQEFHARAREVFDTHKDILALYAQAGEELPDFAGYILRLDLGHQLARLLASEYEDETGWDAIRTETEKAAQWGVTLREPEITHQAKNYMKQQMDRLAQGPEPAIIQRILEFMELAEQLGVDLDLWSCQNRYYSMFLQGFDQASSPGRFREDTGDIIVSSVSLGESEKSTPQFTADIQELGERLEFLMPGDNND